MDIRQTVVFSEWLRKLSDPQARTIFVHLQDGLIGDARCDGSKSTQKSDIEKAKKLAQEI